MLPAVTDGAVIAGARGGASPMPTAVILMYHHLDPRPVPVYAKYTVTPRAFRAQLRWLRLAGYSVVGLDALVSNRLFGLPLPPHPVVITFDDGFRACADVAAPILEEFGFTATFFLVAGVMGQTSRWLRRERGVEFPIMDWRTARELRARDFDLGAHSLTHPRLSELSAAECRHELLRSREILQDELACPVEYLAYPFGAYDARVREMAVSAGYRSACSVRPGRSRADDDLFALQRVPVNGTESLLEFAWRVRTGRPPPERLARLRRGLARRIRRRWRRA